MQQAESHAGALETDMQYHSIRAGHKLQDEFLRVMKAIKTPSKHYLRTQTLQFCMTGGVQYVKHHIASHPSLPFSS